MRHIESEKRLFVQVNAGEPFDIMFFNYYIISKIKQMIFNKNGVSIEKQRLFYKETLLEDNEYIDKYQINENDLIQLNIKKNKVYIFTYIYI